MSQHHTKAMALRLVKEQSARYTNESELPFSNRGREDETKAEPVVEPATEASERVR